MNLRQQVMQRESQITLATAEIDNVNRPGRRQLWQDVFDKFQIPVDLPKLVIHRRSDLPAGQHHADFDQKRTGNTGRNQVLFLAVMSFRFARLLGRWLALDLLRLAIIPTNGQIGFRREKMRIAEIRSKHGLGLNDQFVGRQIVV